MFGRQQLSGTSGGSGNLIEFRAGRMNMIGKMVHPDSRKGLVYMTQGEDGLMHFCWKDRTTGKLEDDLIVFPDDFEFKRVEQSCGRVYVLKFKTSSRRMFFWMQEPKPEKDDEFCRRVNELMNNPPSTQRNGGDGGDLQYMLNNMSQQQLMQLFGGVGQMGGLSSLLGSMNRSDNTFSRTPSSNRSQTATSGSSSSALLTPETNTSAPRTPVAPKGKKPNGGEGSNAGNGNSDNAGSGRSLNIDLSAAIAGSERINEVLSDPDRTSKLSVHLPESLDNDENKKQQIKDTIASPQFQQALSLFSNALQSAQLGPVVSQFELTSDAVAAAYSGNLEDFVKALNKSLPAGATILSSSKEKEDIKMEEGDDKTPTEKKE